MKIDNQATKMVISIAWLFFIIFIVVVGFFINSKMPERNIEQDNVVYLGYMAEITYQNIDNSIETYHIKSNGKVFFEVINGCLTDTEGFNFSVACYVKRIIDIKYKSIYNGKYYYF